VGDISGRTAGLIANLLILNQRRELPRSEPWLR